MDTGRDRIAWLDVARGGTILLVILWHAYLAAKTLGPVDPLVQSLNEKLATVRMPLFFFCSGMLAYWGLNRRWGAILTGRVWTMVWIYLVWSTVTLLLDQAYPVMPWSPEPQGLGSFLWLSYSSQWFVYALVCATLFARAVYYLPVAAQAAAVVAAQLALHAWSPDLAGYTTNFGYLVSTMASYGLLFFMAGIWLSRFVVPILGDPRRAAQGFLAGFGLWLALLLADRTLPAALPAPVTAAPGVFAGLALAALLSRVPPIRQPMQWVGQRTLEIFVCHQLIVGLLTLVCLRMGAGPTAAFLAISAATCAAALGFAWATTAAGPRLLFRPPRLAARRAPGPRAVA